MTKVDGIWTISIQEPTERHASLRRSTRQRLRRERTFDVPRLPPSAGSAGHPVAHSNCNEEK